MEPAHYAVNPEMDRAGFQELFDRCSNWGRWGAEDERGSLNLLRPEHTTRASRLVRNGATVSCSWPLNTVSALDNTRPATHLMLRAGDIADPAAASTTSDYLAIVSHGTAHSHLDALCHFSWRGQIYNGRPAAAVTSIGARNNAITISERGIVTRGVLLDLPRSSGRQWLEPGTAVAPDDLAAAETAERVRVSDGDVLLVRTGRHARRRASGAWDLFTGVAGLHHDCGPWLRDRGAVVMGSDAIHEVLPSGVADVGFPIHILALVAMGLQLLDNLNLDDLAAACAEQGRWEFLLAIAPLRLAGGTASPVNPIAVF